MTPPSPNNGPVLREHTYDGIQEYDQKLPNWWLFTWYITMVWFVIAWVAYYQLSLGESGEEQVDKALANIKAIQLKELEKLTDEQVCRFESRFESRFRNEKSVDDCLFKWSFTEF
jgi:cytochrome c oxidase cbb3-type subunit 3